MNDHYSKLADLCSTAQTRYGEFVFFTHDDPIGKSLREYGEWAESEIALLRQLLRDGDIVVDVGANIGTHTVPISLAVGSSGQVIAIEPQAEIFALLKQNTLANGRGNISLHRAVAGHDRGVSAIPRIDYSAHFNFGGVASLPFAEGEPGDLVQVPRLAIDELGLESCQLMKIDAEGAEIEVLKGALTTLRNHKPALYLECNAVQLGLAAIEFLEGLDYCCFYSATPAFNPDNYRGVADNFFGFAHESSLLFVHRQDQRLLSIVASLGLDTIVGKSDLVQRFVSTLRYGDLPGIPTGEQLRLLERQAKPSQPIRRFSRPVAVIVPVYNAPDYLRRLIASLETAVPEPLPGLNFYFSDDCSPDPEIIRIFESPFFSRPDVRWHRNSQNLGFVGNVNAAVSVLPPDADLVLLNSDTEVWTEIFSVLQQEAYTDPATASVTPLTNNGTIASLFRFPEGSGMPKALSPALISRAVQQLNLDLPVQPAPTAVGFCMYMKREAIEQIGVLDLTYGKGYGEECDWSRRAINAGWHHLITCKAFVLHEGTKSFNDSIKRESLLTNSEILLQRYPEYNDDVGAYITRNPLKFERLLIVLAALQLQTSKPTYLMTLHNDPDSPSGGGTEKHVRSLQRQLDARGHVVLELFPIGNAQFCLRVNSQGEAILTERFQASVIPHLMPLLEPYIDCLHVHHTLYWPEEALSALAKANIYHKIVSAHDYYLLCPSINLLRMPGSTEFCGVEQDESACNTCLQRQNGYHQQVMATYRRKTRSFLEAFDTILFPSDSLRHYFERGFGSEWPRLAFRSQVLNHDLAHLWELETDMDAEPREKSVAFVGALGIHKGSLLILEALPKLKALGYSVEILGSIHPRDARELAGIPITPYESPQELKRLLDERMPAIVSYPATWAETYCYAYYEGLILSDTAVPVVGPYGNPASVTAAEGIGVTMQAATAEALVEACIKASENAKALHENARQYRKRLRLKARPYYEQYRMVAHEIVKLVPHGTGPRRLDLQALAKLDFLQGADHERNHLRSERETQAVRTALKLQAKLRAHPHLKSVLLITLKTSWKALKKLRTMVKG